MGPGNSDHLQPLSVIIQAKNEDSLEHLITNMKSNSPKKSTEKKMSKVYDKYWHTPSRCGVSECDLW